MTQTYKTGDILDLRVERIVPRGLGIGFAEQLTVFVGLAAAGDRLKVRLREVKGRIAFADIVEVIEASAARIEPPCPHFGTCGGCDLQQMTYAAQLEAKSGIVRDCLHRIGKIDVESVEIVPSSQPFEYRSRARWHIDRAAKKVGYFKRDSHEVVAVETCPILTPPLATALTDVSDGMDWEMLFADRAEIDAASDGNELSFYSRDMAIATGELITKAANFAFRYSAEAFFQGNRSLIEPLVELAVGGAAGGIAYDLYCGVGLFALPLAAKFAHVIGVEENAVAVNFARRNAETAAQANLDFQIKRVKSFLSGKLPKPDFVLIDPPRAGAEKGVIERLIAFKPREISYVSCEPSILARDLRTLLDGGYIIDKMTAIDLFPQTHHVETVVRLKAVKS